MPHNCAASPTSFPPAGSRQAEAGALGWQGQIARATRGRDLHLNVPFPRKQPDLLMAESPPTGGLSALNRPAVDPLAARRPSSAPRRPAHLEPPRSTPELECTPHLWRTPRALASNSPSSPSITHSTSER